MALTQVSTEGIKNGTITGTDLATNVDLVDNQYLRIGTGNDLQIFHDGSHSRIKDVGTGILSLSASQLNIQNAAVNENMAEFFENGAVNLYYDNSKKFETVSTGVKIAGNIRVGNGSNLDIKNDNGSETLAKFINNGAVELYHNNVKQVQTTANGFGFVNNCTFSDDKKIQMGASNDFVLTHTGSRSEIHNITGDLLIRADSLKINNAANTEEMARFTTNGAVELYHDNSKKFETSSLGWQSEDDVKGIFGTGGDLQIFHTGTNSFIRKVASGTGQLYLDSQGNGDIYLRAGDGSTSTDISLRCHSSGGVDLRHQGNVKLETTSGGGSLTGDWNVSNDFFWFDNGEAVFGSGGDLKIYHNGSNSYIDNGTGNLYFRGSNGQMLFRPNNNEDALVLKPNGAVELYHDNTKRLETVDVGIHVFNTVRVLGGTAPQIQFNTDTSLGTSTRAMFGMASAANNFVNGSAANDMVLNLPEDFIISNGTTELIARFIKNGAVELYYDNTKRIETISSGAKLIGDASIGNIAEGDFRFKEAGSGTTRVHWRSDEGDIKFNDTYKASFGNSADLQIYHDGSDSNIVNAGTGHLYLYANSSDKGIVIKSNNTVELYHDNSKKLETLSDGIKVTGAIEAAGVPLQQVFNNSNTSLTKTGTGTVTLGFSAMSMTTKRSNSLLVFSYTISGEIDGNRGQCFYRLFYSTSSNFSGEQAVNNTCFQGNSHNVSDGDFSDSGTFHFTNPVSAGTTIYFRMKYSNSNSGASIEFNQQGLSSQPSGTTNISFFRLEELTT